MFILKRVVLKNKGLLYFLPNIQALLDFTSLIMTIIFLLLKANNTNSPFIIHYFSRTNKAPLILVFNKRPVYKGDFTVLTPYILIYKTKKLYLIVLRLWARLQYRIIGQNTFVEMLHRLPELHSSTEQLFLEKQVWWRTTMLLLQTMKENNLEIIASLYSTSFSWPPGNSFLVTDLH